MWFAKCRFLRLSLLHDFRLRFLLVRRTEGIGAVFAASTGIAARIAANSRPSSQDTHSVVVTGNFDNWDKSQGHLAKSSNGFHGRVVVDEPQKLVFKFVLNDSNWVVAPEHKVEHDEHGNANNYVDADELKEVDTDDDLTHVLTNPSSYAAVSPPASGGSGFENISRLEEIPLEEPEASSSQPDTQPASSSQLRSLSASNRNAPDDDTPTNSIHDGEAKRRPDGPQTQESEVVTLGGDSRSSSFTGRLRPEAKTAPSSPLVRVPGSYPAPDHRAESSSGNARRDGLISKLKGLFR